MTMKAVPAVRADTGMVNTQAHAMRPAMAAWDVHRAKLFAHCEKKSGIAPTERLIAEGDAS